MGLFSFEVALAAIAGLAVGALAMAFINAIMPRSLIAEFPLDTTEIERTVRQEIIAQFQNMTEHLETKESDRPKAGREDFCKFWDRAISYREDDAETAASMIFAAFHRYCEMRKIAPPTNAVIGRWIQNVAPEIKATRRGKDRFTAYQGIEIAPQLRLVA